MSTYLLYCSPESIQCKSSRFKVYANMKPNLLSKHDHQIILDKIEARENLNHDEYVDDENYYNVDIYDSYYDDN